jgi:hypothetical protein
MLEPAALTRADSDLETLLTVFNVSPQTLAKTKQRIRHFVLWYAFQTVPYHDIPCDLC